MDDAGVVRGLQTGGDLPGERHHSRDRQALVAQDGRQVRPLDVRHRDVLDAVDLAEVVNADDVLVGDLAREEQFLLEASLDILRRGRVPGHFRPDHLEGDRDFQFLVIGLIDSAHAADAELTQDVIARAELLPGLERPPRLFRTRAGRSRDAGRIGGLVHWGLAAVHGFGVVWVHGKPRASENDGFCWDRPDYVAQS